MGCWTWSKMWGPRKSHHCVPFPRSQRAWERTANGLHSQQREALALVPAQPAHTIWLHQWGADIWATPVSVAPMAYTPQENQCTQHSNCRLRLGILVEAKNILMSCWESLRVTNMTPLTNDHFLSVLPSHFHNLQHNSYSQSLTRFSVTLPPICRSSDVCHYFHSSCHSQCHVLSLGRESIPPTSSWDFRLQ